MNRYIGKASGGDGKQLYFPNTLKEKLRVKVFKAKTQI